MKGSLKCFVTAFGCKVNQYDAQVLRERCAAAGYSDGSAADADLIIINSCTVTAAADRQCRQLVRQLSRRNPRARIVLTGCYAVRLGPDDVAALGPGVEVIADREQIVASAGAATPAGITSFQQRTRAFVKVQDGCDAFCTYCIVPYVRSTLWSKPAVAVVDEVAALVAAGYPEIVLTGVHLGKYDDGLAPLVRRVLDIPGEFRVRLSSLEVNEIGDDLLALFQAYPQKLCPHLHVPLQSAADAVLQRMNRRYTAAAFAQVVASIRKRVPGIGITTDVIVGFPGEQEDDFRATREFVAAAGFSRLHVFPYSPREGTAAAGFAGQVPVRETRRRAALLQQDDAVLREQFWRQFVGSIRQVVREHGRSQALTDNYISLSCPATAPAGAPLLGWARIVAADGIPRAELVEKNLLSTS